MFVIYLDISDNIFRIYLCTLKWALIMSLIIQAALCVPNISFKISLSLLYSKLDLLIQLTWIQVGLVNAKTGFTWNTFLQDHYNFVFSNEPIYTLIDSDSEICSSLIGSIWNHIDPIFLFCFVLHQNWQHGFGNLSPSLLRVANLLSSFACCLKSLYQSQLNRIYIFRSNCSSLDVSCKAFTCTQESTYSMEEMTERAAVQAPVSVSDLQSPSSGQQGTLHTA